MLCRKRRRHVAGRVVEVLVELLLAVEPFAVERSCIGRVVAAAPDHTVGMAPDHTVVVVDTTVVLDLPADLYSLSRVPVEEEPVGSGAI